MIVDSDVYVIVKYVIIIYVIIVVYVDNSVWMVLMCNVCLLYICIVVIYNIDVMCRKNRWNFVVKIKFCYIFDNLRYFSVLEIIIYRYYY